MFLKIHQSFEEVRPPWNYRRYYIITMYNQNKRICPSN